MRAGHFVKQGEGNLAYRAFIPAPLPPDPPIAIDTEMARLLSGAERALGRLDGVTMILPNPDLFLGMYVRQEAVLSSQIEGTQSTLEDVLRYEAGEKGRDVVKDVEGVVNYVAAMNHGLQRVDRLPLSLRLIREIHQKMLAGVRGGDRTPGEFRTSQNWIGPEGSTLLTAKFVPPPKHEMERALDNLEKFLHEREVLPPLIHCGLAHAQFETIHPFLDGNGRVGRLLITFLLCEQKVLGQPLLYLSLYLKVHRQEYYDRLMAVRTNGDWEGWLKFFLRGVGEVSASATTTAKAIIGLRDRHRALVTAKAASSAAGLKLLDHMFQHPYLTVHAVQEQVGVSYVTANNLVKQFENLGLLKEVTGGQRNRRYRYEPYLALFEVLDRPAEEQEKSD